MRNALLAGLIVSLATLPAFAGEAPAGASACSGCHAASSKVSTPAPRLIGLTASDIESAMRAYRTGERPATVMDRIAKGFSEDEVKAIAQWYAAQKE
jgi:cytochrome subunit of sulfide dehydrogenase